MQSLMHHKPFQPFTVALVNGDRFEVDHPDRDTFDRTIRAFKRSSQFQPFTVALVTGDRFEVDHPEAVVVRDGVAIFVAPGGVPVIFDHEGVTEVIGDLAERRSE